MFALLYFSFPFSESLQQANYYFLEIVEQAIIRVWAEFLEQLGGEQF